MVAHIWDEWLTFPKQQEFNSGHRPRDDHQILFLNSHCILKRWTSNMCSTFLSLHFTSPAIVYLSCAVYFCFWWSNEILQNVCWHTCTSETPTLHAQCQWVAKLNKHWVHRTQELMLWNYAQTIPAGSLLFRWWATYASSLGIFTLPCWSFIWKDLHSKTTDSASWMSMSDSLWRNLWDFRSRCTEDLSSAVTFPSVGLPFKPHAG